MSLGKGETPTRPAARPEVAHIARDTDADYSSVSTLKDI